MQVFVPDTGAAHQRNEHELDDLATISLDVWLWSQCTDVRRWYSVVLLIDIDVG